MNGEIYWYDRQDQELGDIEEGCPWYLAEKTAGHLLPYCINHHYASISLREAIDAWLESSSVMHEEHNNEYVFFYNKNEALAFRLAFYDYIS